MAAYSAAGLRPMQGSFQISRSQRCGERSLLILQLNRITESAVQLCRFSSGAAFSSVVFRGIYARRLRLSRALRHHRIALKRTPLRRHRDRSFSLTVKSVPSRCQRRPALSSSAERHRRLRVTQSVLATKDSRRQAARDRLKEVAQKPSFNRCQFSALLPIVRSP